jgi:RNA polymerase sigma-70 factor (ECF subfamily)
VISPEPSDEALVADARQGDRDALVTLYRRYSGEIYGYLFHQLGDVSDAEDVTSETFLRFVRALDTFRGQSSFRTWLYSIARNQLRDHWRRNGRRPRTVGLDAAGEGRASQVRPDTSGVAVEANPRATALGRAVLAELPENYRRVLELRVLEGRTVRDTAEELGLSISNVKVLQHRGLKAAERITERLTDEYGDDHAESGDGDG